MLLSRSSVLHMTRGLSRSSHSPLPHLWALIDTALESPVSALSNAVPVPAWKPGTGRVTDERRFTGGCNILAAVDPLAVDPCVAAAGPYLVIASL